MDREQARDIVKGYIEDYLRGKGINTRKAFTCLNPEHPDKHPSMSYDSRRKRCKCFSCGASYDIFDIIGIDYGLTDPADIFNKAFDLYNIDISKPQPARPHVTDWTTAAGEPEASGGDQKEPEPAKTGKYAEYYKKTREALQDPTAQAYLKQRGISEETAKKHWLGYDEAYSTADQGEDGQQVFASWRALIIPTGWDSFIARNIDRPKEPAKKNRYRKKGASRLFNARALYGSDTPVFITEGELDALSIEEAGGQAVALGSTSNYSQLVNSCKAKAPAQPLILALDRDEEGQKTEAKLAEELTALQIPFYRHNIYGLTKDANEALTSDRDAFIAEVAAAEKIPETEQEAAEAAIIEEYLKNSAGAHIQEFKDGITASVNTPAIRTGFEQLDRLLDGGLYAGLYIIGAISSLGKTTLALQICDNLAQQGQDVIIFSLEMARAELMAKSISRLTFNLTNRRQNAKTTRGIMAGARYAGYSKVEKDLINSAIAEYEKYAGHIFIHEGVGDIGVEQIKDIVKKHITITGNSPVVIVDYVQILAPYDVRSSDKQNTDKAVLELKRLSRAYKIPVIGISSFNRDNYTAPVNLASFKESGAIEYGSDALIGLQYAGMDYIDGETDGARQKRIREIIKKEEANGRTGSAVNIELKVLKHRNGSKGSTKYQLYSMFNCFCEAAGSDDTRDDEEDTADIFKGLRDTRAK